LPRDSSRSNKAEEVEESLPMEGSSSPCKTRVSKRRWAHQGRAVQLKPHRALKTAQGGARRHPCNSAGSCVAGVSPGCLQQHTARWRAPWEQRQHKRRSLTLRNEPSPPTRRPRLLLPSLEKLLLRRNPSRLKTPMGAWVVGLRRHRPHSTQQTDGAGLRMERKKFWRKSRAGPKGAQRCKGRFVISLPTCRLVALSRCVLLKETGAALESRFQPASSRRPARAGRPL
jgi:hypothetical protein